MRFIPLAIQMLLFLWPCAADPFSSLLPQASLDALRAEGRVSSSIRADGNLRLLPSVSSGSTIASDVKGLKPTVGSELLMLITGTSRPADSPEGWLSLYNVLHASSTMRGITYFSTTRGKEEVLFLQSYALDPGTRRTRIPDPTFTSVPAADDLYTFQEDGSFGRNTYKAHFNYQGDHLVVKMENLATISILLLPVVQPLNLVSQVVLVPRDGEILFYGATYMRTDVSIGSRKAREQSLKNRLLAMAGWLQARLSQSNRS